MEDAWIKLRTLIKILNLNLKKKKLIHVDSRIFASKPKHLGKLVLLYPLCTEFSSMHRRTSYVLAFVSALFACLPTGTHIMSPYTLPLYQH
jgi:hypothetical protein